MRRSYRPVIAILLVVCAFSCKTPYNPLGKPSVTGYLVIDGIINTGNDSTIIKLSRTVPLNSKTATQPELNAIISIESDANATSYSLKPVRNGIYGTGPLNLSKTARYRLRIHTYNGSTYLSDFTSVKESPPIDSVFYTLGSNGAQINAATHDATNSTHYYRYEYIETWMFHPYYHSTYIAKNNAIVSRTSAEDIYTCWRSYFSPEILLVSTAKLTSDIVFNSPVTIVPQTSLKLSQRYSILVKQYALTEDAFNFWQLVKKNTEQLGSIFDAQPSQIQGNIHNINDITEPAFGYISAGTVQQKRIFIDHNSLPNGWVADNPTALLCANLGNPPDTSISEVIPVSKYILFFEGRYVPVQQTGGGYFGAAKFCGDCTLQGSNVKPSFW